MPGPDRNRRLTAFVAAMAVLIATPLAVVASDRFNDVPESNVFHDDIAWLAENGLTLGCNPPDNDEFCPTDNVTRQQMAAFLHRLADNQVVDAAMLDGRNGTAYESRRASASCATDLTAGTTSCIAATGGSLPETEGTEVLRVSLNPRSTGLVETHVFAGTDADVMWLTSNEACAASPTDEAIFQQALNGQLFAIYNQVDSFDNEVAGSLAFTAPAGTQTIRLCGLSMDSGGGTVVQASLTAEWSQGGSLEVAASTAGAPIPAAFLDRIREVLGG